jgi:putative effector of murein hydrolase LrgA (UPF0299 family)
VATHLLLLLLLPSYVWGVREMLSVQKEKCLHKLSSKYISNYSNLVTTGLLLASNYKSTTFRSEQNPMFRAAESHSLSTM